MSLSSTANMPLSLTCAGPVLLLCSLTALSRAAAIQGPECNTPFGYLKEITMEEAAEFVARLGIKSGLPTFPWPKSE